MLEKILLALPALVLGIISLVLALDARKHSRKRETDTDWQVKIDGLRDEIRPLTTSCRTSEADLLVLKKQMEVFWRGVGFSASQALHSPHNPELDALIEKFQEDHIDNEELVQFKTMLLEIAESDEETAFHRKNARDVLTLIRIRYEITPDVVSVRA